jgi:hypothetical protein
VVNGLNILIWNSTKKSLANALSGIERGLREGGDGCDPTNVQYKPNHSCHYKSPHPV